MQKFEAVGETAYLAHKQTIAVSFVRHHPLFFAGVSLRRAVRFWTGFWSFQPSYLQSEPLDVPNVFFCPAALSGRIASNFFHRMERLKGTLFGDSKPRVTCARVEPSAMPFLNSKVLQQVPQSRSRPRQPWHHCTHWAAYQLRNFTVRQVSVLT